MALKLQVVLALEQPMRPRKPNLFVFLELWQG